MSRRRKRKAQQQRRTVVIDIPAPVDAPPLLPGPESPPAGEADSVLPYPLPTPAQRAAVAYGRFLITRGAADFDLVESIRSKFPELSAEETAIVTAQSFGNDCFFDPLCEMGRSIGICLAIVEDAMKAGQFSPALQAAKERTRLLNLAEQMRQMT